MARRRLKDSDLLLLENILAAQSGIVQECRRLAIDYGHDPDLLESLVRIMERSARTRQSVTKLIEELRNDEEE